MVGGNLNNVAKFIRLPPKRQAKVHTALEAISPASHNNSLRKWRKLLGILRSITPAIEGSQGMSTLVKHALTKAAGQHVHLPADVNDKINAWIYLMSILFSRPTHLRELDPFPTTCIGMSNTSGSGMGGVC